MSNLVGRPWQIACLACVTTALPLLVFTRRARLQPNTKLRHHICATRPLAISAKKWFIRAARQWCKLVIGSTPALVRRFSGWLSRLPFSDRPTALLDLPATNPARPAQRPESRIARRRSVLSIILTRLSIGRRTALTAWPLPADTHCMRLTDTACARAIL